MFYPLNVCVCVRARVLYSSALSNTIRYTIPVCLCVIVLQQLYKRKSIIFYANSTKDALMLVRYGGGGRRADGQHCTMCWAWISTTTFVSFRSINKWLHEHWYYTHIQCRTQAYTTQLCVCFFLCNLCACSACVYMYIRLCYATHRIYMLFIHQHQSKLKQKSKKICVYSAWSIRKVRSGKSYTTHADAYIFFFSVHASLQQMHHNNEVTEKTEKTENVCKLNFGIEFRRIVVLTIFFFFSPLSNWVHCFLFISLSLFLSCRLLSHRFQSQEPNGGVCNEKCSGIGLCARIFWVFTSTAKISVW